MKNLIRICAAVLVVGLLCCIGGAAAGGRLYSTIRGNMLLPFGWGAPRLQPAEEDASAGGSGRHGIQSPVWEPSLPEPGGDLPAIDGALPGVTEIRELDIDLGAGNYRIVTGDAYGMEFPHGSYGDDWIESDIDDGVWKIHTDSSWLNFGFGDARSCTIVVPEGCTVEKLEISVGAANVEVDALMTAEKVELEVGAGNLTISGIAFTDRLDAEVGAGNLDLGLPGAPEDYRFDAEVAMGTITVNGSDLVTGLIGSAHRGDGSLRVDIETGMGCVNIYTEK